MDGVREAAQMTDPLTHLGLKIRQARKSVHLTLTQLAERVNLTASHISQIERGITHPSVSSLLSIAGALDLPMEYFFSREDDPPAEVHSTADAHAMLTVRRAATDARPDQNQSWPRRSDPGNGGGGQLGPVVTPPERETINIIGGIQWQRLTPTNEEAIEFIELHYAPGASSGETAYTHKGREFGTVLQGTLEVELGFSKYTLHPGDAITFDCTTPHRLVNKYDDLFVGLWVILDR
jgi:transcriptional regulator with XRE-family HTH domain